MARIRLGLITLMAAAAVGLTATPALAAKCSCSNQADCTCKKGNCKCAKCSGHHKADGASPDKGA